MKATVLVEKVGPKRFRATTAQPVPMKSEGSTKDQAVKRLHTLAKKRIAAGHMVQIDLPDAPTANPWRAFAGIWKDHPEFEAFLEDVAEYRKANNQADSVP